MLTWRETWTELVSMFNRVKSAIRKSANLLGYDVVPANPPAPAPHYLMSDPGYRDIISAVQPFTMTSCERIVAVVDATRYISCRGIPGAIVECGVWRGGSMMAAALTLQEAHDVRDLYLFDTFSGMTRPTNEDVDFRGDDARDRFVADANGTDKTWCYASIDDVRRNLGQLDYPQDRIHFVQGDVLETLPGRSPDQIALLRLDTDWYESTRREMEVLYGKLASGGVLIVDDYGHWGGSRKAVDEYFGTAAPLLCRIDYTGRIAVKP
jgi:O-methyltransferase